jgi:hypothetical protein
VWLLLFLGKTRKGAQQKEIVSFPFFFLLFLLSLLRTKSLKPVDIYAIGCGRTINRCLVFDRKDVAIACTGSSLSEPTAYRYRTLSIRSEDICDTLAIAHNPWSAPRASTTYGGRAYFVDLVRVASVQGSLAKRTKRI